LVATPQTIQEIEIIDIPIDEIKVTNRLRAVSEEKVEELVESIQQIGILHPLVVSKRSAFLTIFFICGFLTLLTSIVKVLLLTYLLSIEVNS